ncbi:hypothetical protein THF1C08_140084 [Vibrio jasicida]|uniref:Transposase n=1 Tax=Vibrio jasicida TaxID=766224 RepID=A0AAU9QHU9_9VIBR|nr:hypothetical protein THF1C08_140084 [Vibrio jasicida]CAH1575310.1 hypothetical protein THF1A12_130084 [Vibrio jasicida]
MLRKTNNYPIRKASKSNKAVRRGFNNANAMLKNTPKITQSRLDIRRSINLRNMEYCICRR